MKKSAVILIAVICAVLAVTSVSAEGENGIAFAPEYISIEITAPKYGAKPDYSAEATDGAGITAQVNAWYTPGEGGPVPFAGDKAFEKDKDYIAEVAVRGITENDSVKINGGAAYISGTDDGTVLVCAQFTASEPAQERPGSGFAIAMGAVAACALAVFVFVRRGKRPRPVTFK